MSRRFLAPIPDNRMDPYSDRSVRLFRRSLPPELRNIFSRQHSTEEMAEFSFRQIQFFGFADEWDRRFFAEITGRIQLLINQARNFFLPWIRRKRLVEKNERLYAPGESGYNRVKRRFTGIQGEMKRLNI